MAQEAWMIVDEGPVYTKGKSYRARAEARQRRYRAQVLGVSHGRYGHLLSTDAADAGSNFIIEEAFLVACARQQAGKGVAQRTFDNMLSSQAMCFNVFAPLATRLDLAAEVLRPFISGLLEITALHIEYTPARDVFRDQTGLGGVDCDVLIEGWTEQGRLVQIIETKLVEPEFSVCGFRKPGRAAKGQDVCAEDVPLLPDRSACLYVRNKGYAYWERTDEHDLLADDALQPQGCPFGGSRWQLWVNLALAHEEAARREATDVRFAVCSSAQNDALLDGGDVLEGFKALLREPDKVSLIDLEALLAQLQRAVPPELSDWADALVLRYAGI
jgi:hypothetical protein